MTRLEQAILDLLASRNPQATVCPSEVARSVDAVSWRALMPQVRDAAVRLADERTIEVTQGGRVVDPRTARGPIRLRRGPFYVRRV